MANLLSYNQATLEGSPSGWVANSNCSVVLSTDQAQQGTQSLKMTATANGFAKAILSNVGVPVTPGQQYTARLSHRSSTSRQYLVTIVWRTAAGADISESVPAWGNWASGWLQTYVTATAPSTAAYATMVWYVDALAGGVYYMDEAQIAPGNSTAWASPPAPISLTATTATVSVSALPARGVASVVQAAVASMSMTMLAPAPIPFISLYPTTATVQRSMYPPLATTLQFPALVDYNAAVNASNPAIRWQLTDGTTPGPQPGFGAATITRSPSPVPSSGFLGQAYPQASGPSYTDSGLGLPNMAGDWTFEFWAQPDDVVDNILLWMDDTTQAAATRESFYVALDTKWGNDISMRVYPATQDLMDPPERWANPSTESFLEFQNPLHNNGWHYFVITNQNDKVSLYVDKVLWLTGTFRATTANFNRLYVGGLPGYSGKLSQFAIYTRALTNQEVIAHFDAAFRWNPGPPFALTSTTASETEDAKAPIAFGLNPLSLVETLAQYEGVIYADAGDARIVRVQVDSGAKPPVSGFGAKEYDGTEEDVITVPTNFMRDEWTIEFWARPRPQFSNIAISLYTSLPTPGNYTGNIGDRFNIHVGEMNYSLWLATLGDVESEVAFDWLGRKALDVSPGDMLAYKPSFYTDTNPLGTGASDTFVYQPGPENPNQPGTFQEGGFVVQSGTDSLSGFKLPEIHYDQTQGVPFRHNIIDNAPELNNFWHHYAIVKTGDSDSNARFTLYVDGRIRWSGVPAGWYNPRIPTPNPYRYEWPGEGPYTFIKLAAKGLAYRQEVLTPTGWERQEVVGNKWSGRGKYGGGAPQYDTHGNLQGYNPYYLRYNPDNVSGHSWVFRNNLIDQPYAGGLSQLTFVEKAWTGAQVRDHYVTAMAGITTGPILMYASATAKKFVVITPPTRTLSPRPPLPPKSVLAQVHAYRYSQFPTPDFKFRTVIRVTETGHFDSVAFAPTSVLTGEPPVVPIDVEAAVAVLVYDAPNPQIHLMEPYVPPPPPPPIQPAPTGDFVGERVDIRITSEPVEIRVST